MTDKRIRACFMRGGTSKAVMFRQEDLPTDCAEWDQIFLQIMGSPDPNGRQLDGMGGGVSSLSKVCVIGPSDRDDADVDYTFAQISIGDAVVDYAGNCGNMSTAIGPFAVEEGFVSAPASGEAMVRIFNTNTSKIIVSRFKVEGARLATNGDLQIDGVSGAASPIRLEFVDPGGAKTGRLLPTGQASEMIDIPELGEIMVSMVDAANPCVFLEAASLGKTGSESPFELEGDAVFLTRMEAIRQVASVRMGMTKDLAAAAKMASVPKVAIVTAPIAMTKLNGDALNVSDMAIGVRMMSMGQAHRAVPVSGALCLAAATRIPGSIPNILSQPGEAPIRIAHPSGVAVVDAKLDCPAEDGNMRVAYAAVFSTARRLFEGSAVYRAAD